MKGVINEWWKEGVIYQIYPRSFKDTNGDGIGDLRGIIEKLDYLKKLGVDILWLSPIFKSPNDDNGYDISDYTSIMEECGTMADFDELLEKAHQKGLKILLDLVVNHSSDEHEWFQQARSSKDNPYRDFYIWEKEKPNNWKSFFSPSTWQYDERTEEYYLHLFSIKQPDLNWENPKLRQAVYSDMRFWLDKGVDGFRMDVIPFISKRLDWPEATEDFNKTIIEVYSNGPRLHEFLKEMNEEVLSHYDVASVGEGIGVTPSNANLYVHKERGELNMLYHFEHLFIDHGKGGKYDPIPVDYARFKEVFRNWDKVMQEGGWVNICLDNHDFPRLVSRFGEDENYREISAKLFAVLLLTQRGTPCIYQGTEIGMTNVTYDSLEDYDDLEVKNEAAQWEKEGKDLNQLLKAVHRQGRDNARTPVQWNGSPNAGFTKGEPWLKVNPNFTKINVENALADKNSIFYFYQKMLSIRKQNKSFIYADTHYFETNDDRLFAYQRKDEEGDFIVVLNLSSEVKNSPENIDTSNHDLMLTNIEGEAKKKLNPWEARIYKKE